jgi:large subunit ribosomal protein L9
MEIILKKDVSGIGKAGSVVKVKDGYARNFLFPGGLALPCTSENLRKLEQEKQKKLLESEKAKSEAEVLKNKLAGLSLTITVLTQEDEKIFGSVGATEIARALNEEGFQIDKNIILLDEPIKALGIYEIPIKTHPEVIAKVKIWIVKK